MKWTHLTDVPIVIVVVKVLSNTISHIQNI